MAGTEVSLESQTLRLRGNADRIRALGPNLVEVRDVKSGTTLDEEGAIKGEIALQLQAYGLLVLEQLPEVEVRLVVDDGTDREVPFDDDAKHAARKQLQLITKSMPPAGRVAVNILARPGRACWGCSVRHVCSAYLAIAPSWWKRHPADIERLPSDVWGTIIEVQGSGTVNIVLKDDAGRRVRIDNVDARHGLSAAMVGSHAWFFGLEASGVCRGFDGARFHPRSFRELPRDRLDRRAWALHVFEDRLR